MTTLTDRSPMTHAYDASPGSRSGACRRCGLDETAAIHGPRPEASARPATDVRTAYETTLDALAACQRRRIEVERKQQTLTDALRLLEARLVIEISMQADEKGKVRYSNEALREAALTIAKAEHAEHRGLVEQVRPVRERLRDAAIEEEYLRGRLEGFKLFAAAAARAES